MYFTQVIHVALIESIDIFSEGRSGTIIHDTMYHNNNDNDDDNNNNMCYDTRLCV